MLLIFISAKIIKKSRNLTPTLSKREGGTIHLKKVKNVLNES